MKTEAVALGALAARVGGRIEGGDVVVSSVSHDSRTVQPGGLFVAIRGLVSDGHDFLAAAVAAGAAGVVVERTVAVPVPSLIVADTREALAPLAAAVYGDPSTKVRVVGITGTNGKTTVSHILESIASAADIRFGMVGTVGARIAGAAVPVARTTPEGSDLQRLLASMVASGIELAVLEVSSHALELHRVDAIGFSTVAFTNLSQDHLDFHGDMERYYQAKAKLFEAGRAAAAVISIDDDAGRRLAASVSIPVTTVAMARDADVTAVVIDAGLEATTIDIAARSFRETVRVPLAGGFNVSNVAVAAAVAEAEGIAADAVVAGVEAVPEIPGRFQRLDEGQAFGVVVDYAHTPDAVANVIGSVRSLVAGRVVAVLGAGGDRDREKRPMMGAAAATADVAVITSDNPRSEDPAAIVAEVMSGAARGAATVVAEVDRRSAIIRAIEEAQPGDVVLILGKGHETGQEIAGRVEPFDDRVVARQALAKRLAGNGSSR